MAIAMLHGVLDRAHRDYENPYLASILFLVPSIQELTRNLTSSVENTNF